MERKIDSSLMDIKRGIHRLIHEDGSYDIFSGYLLITSPLMTLDSFPFVFIGIDIFFMILGLIGLSLMRKKIIFPRVGIIRPPRPKKKYTIISLLVTFAFFGLLICWIVFDWSYSTELMNSISNQTFFPMLMLALLFVFELGFSIWLRSLHVFISSIVFITGAFFGWVGEFIGLSLLVSQIIACISGVVLIVFGCYFLVQFTKKYPVLIEGEIFDPKDERSEDFSDE